MCVDLGPSNFLDLGHRQTGPDPLGQVEGRDQVDQPSSGAQQAGHLAAGGRVYRGNQGRDYVDIIYYVFYVSILVLLLVLNIDNIYAIGYT